MQTSPFVTSPTVPIKIDKISYTSKVPPPPPGVSRSFREVVAAMVLIASAIVLVGATVEFSSNMSKGTCIFYRLGEKAKYVPVSLLQLLNSEPFTHVQHVFVYHICVYFIPMTKS